MTMNRKTLTRFACAAGTFIMAGIAFAFASDGAATDAAASAGRTEVLKWLALGAPIGLGLAVIGCGLGQGRMAAQAMAGIARNPQASGTMFVPMILGLAFIESLTIYALIFVFIFRAAFPL